MMATPLNLVDTLNLMSAAIVLRNHLYHGKSIGEMQDGVPGDLELLRAIEAARAFSDVLIYEQRNRHQAAPGAAGE